MMILQFQRKMKTNNTTTTQFKNETKIFFNQQQ